jgi:hypothetical protein
VPYESKKLQILGGGFNALPPVDKVPSTDYLIAQNWRVDRTGRLVSRFGYQQKFSIASAGIAHSAALHGGVDGDYYVGCNTSIASPTPSKLYWNFNASAIASGFDGNRIGMAAMNGWMYFMNRGAQGRHQASLGAGTSQAWNLDAPSSSPAASTTSTPSTSTSVTYSYTLQSDPTYIHSLTIAGVTYQFAENGYSAGQLPLVIASLASADPNCTVTYSGTGSDVVIAPIQSNVLIAVSGSDSNTPTNLANGSVTSLPNGIYTLYVTYQTADDSLESNPSPVSNAVTAANQAVSLTSIPVSADGRVGVRNVYAIGGTLASAYLIGSIADNSTTSATFSWADLDVTNAGITMPTTNDPPPAASGVAGPHFSRLFAWSTAANPNRLFYTEPDLPQYWPGSGDPAVGNWADVGTEGEAILWCTFHGNTTVIYKERSIWMLVGDPSTGYLQRLRDDLGPDNAFAIVEAGSIDYFVAAGSLQSFDGNNAADGFAAAVQPLFTGSLTYNPMSPTPPGSVLPGSSYNASSTAKYAVALGYALGKLYVGYAEQAGSTSYCLLVYHEDSARWFYHRNGISGVTGFFGFVFDGVQMVGLSGSTGGAAIGENLDDFRAFATTDPGSAAIACAYQSHYEDCGLPDIEKVWLEAAIDYEFSGDTANVYIGTDGGATFAAIGTIAGTGRITKSFPLAFLSGTAVIKDPSVTAQTDLLAKNLSIAIAGSASNALILHNVYLYYYAEARLSSAVSTLPSDLGLPAVKQCKELEVDVDPNGNAVQAIVGSDLPGNLMAVRQTLAVSSQAGRALLKVPFAVTEGYLWKLALASTAGPFRVYGARLLMRPIGVHVDAYEAAAGFVWDSEAMSFDSGVTHIPRGYAIALAALPIKRARSISLEIETFGGNVTVALLTDLPGDAQAVRFTDTVVNTGTAGRRFVRIPLPQGTTPAIEGRMFRLQISGATAFRLYGAAVEILAVGVYIEAYEAAGGAVYDSREIDFGIPAFKEARELELDLETTGAISAQLLGDANAGGTMVSEASQAGLTTTGRQKLIVPLTVNAATSQFVEGRMFRLILSGTNAFRLYGARLLVRQFGCYLSASETSGGGLWDSTELDLGSQTVKQLREIELEIWAYGSYTVTVYTDLPGNAMAVRAAPTLGATGGRTKVQIPLPQGQVPDNYLFGRLVRVTVTSASAFKLFGARIHVRPIGVYVESYEAAGGAVWDSTPTNLGSPNDKTFDELRFEMDTDGAAQVTAYTDLPGEVFIAKGQYPLTTGATSRHWATVPLPAGIEGRSVRLVVSSAAGFRIYKAQVRHSRIGRYLCAATPAGNDSFRSLEFDFGSERVKPYKKIELDMRADGQVALQVLTDQSGALAVMYSPMVATPNGRQTLNITLPPGIRGRLLRVGLTSSSQARIYRLRVWTRRLNEGAGERWGWDDYPLEESDVLPAWADLTVPETPDGFSWADLPVEPTKPEWTWAPFPVNPTEAQWFWAKVLSVPETPDEWTWVTVPLEAAA